MCDRSRLCSEYSDNSTGAKSELSNNCNGSFSDALLNGLVISCSGTSLEIL